MDEKNYSNLRLIAGGAFALGALFKFIRFAGNFFGYNFFYMITNFALLAALVVCTVSFFVKGNEQLLVYGLAGYTAVTALQEVVFVLRTLFLNFFMLIPNFIDAVLSIVSVLLATAVAFLFLMYKDKKYTDIAKTYWYVPAIAFGVWLIFSIFTASYMTFSTFLFNLIFSVACVATCVFLIRPDVNIPVATPQSVPVAQVSNIGYDGFCDITKHTLLLFFTFGIWLYIWIYRVTGLLNNVEGEEYRDPTKKLLLCMFVPFYYIYWTYKSAQRIDKLARSRGINSDLETICLILAIFINIIPPILMQDKINAVAVKYN